MTTNYRGRPEQSNESKDSATLRGMRFAIGEGWEHNKNTTRIRGM